MSSIPSLPPVGPGTADAPLLPRRSFLRYSGAGLAVGGLLLAGCDDDNDDITPGGTIDVGSGDTGVLNYAYALEQLEAAFYAKVKEGAYYKGLAGGSLEKQVFDDLAIHEQIHADFFKKVLDTKAIKALEPDFSTIKFDDRNSVLGAAKSFEDLGVAAYNGAGRYIQTPAYLLIAGKIVSVEARHAALIRDLINYNTFVGSDVVDLFTPTNATSAPGVGSGTGKEKSMMPTDVVNMANKFLKDGSKISASNIK
ncbi:ferritin-like domain-containing protein [Hymenobacter actinosclerus]|uniref:Ferritin-like domain-containing protein n=1 Tax=Hymenobacter actinosclerus TaxID=82805 RepID=A0A1I0I977_9BACT|nr:ferritin-like domain-containing protein [Hymenobacter actinosclerus]SET93250.1 Ferritin-like domain-containing protein [Hymenobacter actinosclerus]